MDGILALGLTTAYQIIAGNEPQACIAMLRRDLALIPAKPKPDLAMP